MDKSKERSTEIALDVATVAIWEIVKKVFTTGAQKGGQKIGEKLDEYSKREQSQERARLEADILSLRSEDPKGFANLVKELHRLQKRNDGSEAETVNSLIEFRRVTHPNEHEAEEIWNKDAARMVKNPKHATPTRAAKLHEVWRDGLGLIAHDVKQLKVYVEIIHDDRLEQFFGQANSSLKKFAKDIKKFRESSPTLSATEAHREHQARKKSKTKGRSRKKQQQATISQPKSLAVRFLNFIGDLG